MNKPLDLRLLAILLLSLVAHAQTFSEELEEEVGRVLASMRTALDNSDRIRVGVQLDKLVEMGPDVIPVLVSELKENDRSSGERSRLVDTVAKIERGGRSSTKALVDLAVTHQDPEIRARATNWVDNRIIDFSLSEHETQTLLSRITTEHGHIAAQWAYALARATHVDDRIVVKPLIDRFKKEIKSTKNAPVRFPSGPLLNDEAFYLNKFLRAFLFCDPDHSLPVLRREISDAEDSRSRFWLQLAAGMSGDRTVGNDLLNVISSESEDISSRALALKAYSRAMTKQAIPLLEQYKADDTPGPLTDFPPLAIIARDELVRLMNRP